MRTNTQQNDASFPALDPGSVFGSVHVFKFAEAGNTVGVMTSLFDSSQLGKALLPEQ